MNVALRDPGCTRMDVILLQNIVFTTFHDHGDEKCDDLGVSICSIYLCAMTPFPRPGAII